jgi:hypothetical protein
MIQACYQDLCRSGGTHPKIALAIHFFKEEWKVAPEEEKTFCPEVETQGGDASVPTPLSHGDS